MNKQTTSRRSSRRKPSVSKNKAKRTTKASNPERKYELMGLVFLAIGLISICGLWGLNVGFVGVYFAKILHYLFGIGAIVVTLIVMLIGYQYIVKHHGIGYSLRFIGMIMLFFSVLAIWHHLVIPAGAEIMPSSLPKGGGLIGGGILFILRKFFGADGAIIILVLAVVGEILLSTTWSLAAGVLKTQRTAARGANAAANVASEAMSVAYEKAIDVGERVEEQVARTVREKVRKRAVYNQEKDLHFTANANETDFSTEKTSEAVAVQNEVNDDNSKKITAENKESAKEKLPEFTIEYGRAEETAASKTAPSPKLMKEKRTVMPSYSEIAPIKPAAAILEANEGKLATAADNATTEAMTKPYELPKITDILSKIVKTKNAALEKEISDNAHILQQTLADFKVKATIINACHGPAVTRYELEPAPGVKVSKITNLADDIALRLAAASVRIEQIPGKSAIGIEVPNRELEGVQLREVLESPKFAAAKSKLTVGLGMDIGGSAIFADLAKMPHLLVAGATGSGKSVCINTLITSVLFKAKPDEVKFILVDPKMVELSNYNGIPHLMVPVVTDAKKAASVLNWSVQEMEKRYSKFAENNVRNMETFNKKFPDETMPAIVIIIDELADLMMVAPHDVEDAICRLAQKARAAGIHMILATQRPSVDVITGIIKANIPSRISFAVSSQIDSRTILDRSGAEKLLGKGDMLFYPVGASKPVRVQGAFISDDEVESLLTYIRAQGQEMETNEEIVAFTEQAAAEEAAKNDASSKPKVDELLPKAVNLIMSTNQASTSSVQRRLGVGYTRAARLMDIMEELGIVGPNNGSKSRDILMTNEQAQSCVAEVM